jgi:hypothetical protein
MYYVDESDATLIISVNRLDRDDILRTLPILKILLEALAAHGGRR